MWFGLVGFGLARSGVAWQGKGQGSLVPILRKGTDCLMQSVPFAMVDSWAGQASLFSIRLCCPPKKHAHVYHTAPSARAFRAGAVTLFGESSSVPCCSTQRPDRQPVSCHRIFTSLTSKTSTCPLDARCKQPSKLTWSPGTNPEPTSSFRLGNF